MKKGKRYSCDGGCIAVGNSLAQFHIPNGYGDGSHKVFVMDDDSLLPKDAHWKCSVEGDLINIYDYDCHSSLDEMRKHILFTLKGRYGVYSNCGDMYFCKRDK